MFVSRSPSSKVFGASITNLNEPQHSCDTPQGGLLIILQDKTKPPRALATSTIMWIRS